MENYYRQAGLPMHDYHTAKFEWEERYALGVASIDDAHEEMFKVMNRVHRMLRIGGNIKWTVAEALKFFRSYATKHFEDEETFMRSVNYARYEEHKRVHDGMRDKILPRLYSLLEKSDYSPEAIEQFMGVCEKWLTKHILGHDRDLVAWVEEPEKVRA